MSAEQRTRRRRIRQRHCKNSIHIIATPTTKRSDEAGRQIVRPQRRPQQRLPRIFTLRSTPDPRPSKDFPPKFPNISKSTSHSPASDSAIASGLEPSPALRGSAHTTDLVRRPRFACRQSILSLTVRPVGPSICQAWNIVGDLLLELNRLLKSLILARFCRCAGADTRRAGRANVRPVCE